MYRAPSAPRSKPGSACPSGSDAGSIALLGQRIAEQQDGLAVPVLLLQEIDRRASGRQAGVAGRDDDAVPEHGRGGRDRHLDVDRLALGRHHLAQPGADEARHRAGIGERGVHGAQRRRASMPSATSSATWRVATLPSPGRAISESAGERSTSGAAGFSRTRACGAGTSMPRPSATLAGQLGRGVGDHRDRRARAPPRRRPW